MEENKGSLLKYAMSYGLALGIFWVVKYLFFIFGYYKPAFLFVYEVLCLTVPFIAYYLTKQYRDEIGGSIRFFHAWQFGILLYFFAALIVSIEHYVFYKFIAAPDFLSNVMEQAFALLKKANADEEMIAAAGQVNYTPIYMAIQGIFNNVFYGIVFSLPVAAIVCRKRTESPVSET